jgi:hypothetical protein
MWREELRWETQVRSTEFVIASYISLGHPFIRPRSLVGPVQEGKASRCAQSSIGPLASEDVHDDETRIALSAT